MTLTQAQTAVVAATEPYLLVSAGPGAGKSRVLVERIVRLVRDGADPARIVAISYTNAASAVLQDRLGDIRLGACGTLHSFCFSLLSRHGHIIGLDGPLSVIDQDGEMDLMTEAMEDMSWPGSKKELILEIAKGPVNRTFPLSRIGIAAHAFFQKLAADRIMTFDMILHHAERLLLAMRDQGIGLDVDHLLVDEVQDCTAQDWNIIEATNVPNIFAVGDGDQRIFSFRGSSDGFDTRCKMANPPNDQAQRPGPPDAGQT